MAAMDGFMLSAVTKGRTSILGGDEAGIDIRPAHSVAVSWAAALRFATFWNHETYEDHEKKKQSPNNVRPPKSAPMLAVVTVAPLLAHAGLSYVKHLDSLLEHTKSPLPGFPSVQMLDLAKCAVEKMDEPFLNDREKMHLKVLNLLLEDKHRHALVVVLRILRICPGDALALSLAIDLANTVGDTVAASQAASSTISYWHERRGGLIKPAIPGHSIALSLISLGFAVGGHIPEAEQMAEGAMTQGSKVCGALATWAKAHIFDAGGRVSEGISALSNTDGIVNYEDAAFLFFNSRLGGYGARFSMDREERGRGKSAALRLYGNHFERVLEYSGFATRQPWSQPLRKAPISWSSNRQIEQSSDRNTDGDSVSFIDRLMGRKTEKRKKMEEHYELVLKQDESPSKIVEGWDPSSEDVLTWLPPTPIFLSDATLLLFRLTLNGTVSTNNDRWDNIRNAWEAYFDIHKRHRGKALDFSPLVSLSSSILLPPSETGGDRIGSGALARGLNLMGQLLKLGSPEADGGSDAGGLFPLREHVAKIDTGFWYPNTDGTENEWKKVVLDLTSAVDGVDPDDNVNLGSIAAGSRQKNDEVDFSRLRYDGWTFDSRPIMEHAIVYSACKSGDIESLSVARSICSRGVTMRSASPEEWWRYSIVLGLLGDEVASQNAWTASMNAGGGQGARA